MAEGSVFKGGVFEIKADYYVVPVFSGDKKQFSAKEYGKYGAEIKKLFDGGKLRHEFRKKTIMTLCSGANKLNVFFAGMGRGKKLTREKIRQAAGFVIRELGELGVSNFAAAAWSAEDGKLRAQAEGFFLGAYKYQGIKNKKEKNGIKEFFIASKIKNADVVVSETKIITANACLARDIMNSPANYATPSKLEKLAKEIAVKNKKIMVRSFGKEEAKTLKMGAFYAVAKGSDEPAKFIIMEYRNGVKGEKPFVFIGKGITFDSGGISLKPQASGVFKIEDMKYDMSGAAAVLYLMKTAAELRIKKNLVALIPATENLPSGKAYKPGDVITTHSGKTVEIISTDAEGRMILADALSYAAGYRPELIIDLATLTGACVVALGHYATGMMGNNDGIMEALKEAGKKTGEKVWQLPLWEEYREQIKSRYADIKNTGGGDAGTITAGLFLREFTGDIPWVHLDIAGTAYGVKNKTYIPDGVSAVGIRLLTEFLKNY